MFAMFPIVHAFAGNGLTDISASIGALSSLRTLRVSDNALVVLPGEIASLPLLAEVYVGGNNGLDRESVEEVLRQRPDIAIVWDGKGDAAEKLGTNDSARR